MAGIGRTLLRFTGALLLGASATALDDPGVLSAPTVASRIPIPARLAREGTGAGLEVAITPGKRAYAVRVNDASDFGGLVRPNTRVDVMVVIDDRGQNKRFAKLFMENMRVLAIGRVPSAGAGNRGSNGDLVATLEVTPVEAERLSIAAAQGTLHLLLRGYGDSDGAMRPGEPGGIPQFADPGNPCGEPSRRALVRDLLRRTCVNELVFQKDSAVIRVKPPGR